MERYGAQNTTSCRVAKVRGENISNSPPPKDHVRTKNRTTSTIGGIYVQKKDEKRQNNNYILSFCASSWLLTRISTTSEITSRVINKYLPIPIPRPQHLFLVLRQRLRCCCQFLDTVFLLRSSCRWTVVAPPPPPSSTDSSYSSEKSAVVVKSLGSPSAADASIFVANPSFLSPIRGHLRCCLQSLGRIIYPPPTPPLSSSKPSFIRTC